jgi:hypothetical protein
MIVLLVLLLRRAMTPARLAEAREQAARGIAGRMEGHAAMDMSLAGGSMLARALSGREHLILELSHRWTSCTAPIADCERSNFLSIGHWR